MKQKTSVVKIRKDFKELYRYFISLIGGRVCNPRQQHALYICL